MPPNRTPRTDALGCPETDPGPIRNMHDVFADPCRRAIVYHLQDRDRPTTVRDLTRTLYDRNQDVNRRTAQVGPSLEQFRSHILRSHILAMEEFGILEYDPSEETIWLPDSVEFSVTPPWDQRGNRDGRALSNASTTRSTGVTTED